MCEKEYGSARRCEFSLLQMFPSHQPNFPSGPSGERPIHSSMPAVRPSTAMKTPMIHRWRFRNSAGVEFKVVLEFDQEIFFRACSTAARISGGNSSSEW